MLYPKYKVRFMPDPGLMEEYLRGINRLSLVFWLVLFAAIHQSVQACPLTTLLVFLRMHPVSQVVLVVASGCFVPV
jgi:hypothetical protein